MKIEIKKEDEKGLTFKDVIEKSLFFSDSVLYFKCGDYTAYKVGGPAGKYNMFSPNEVIDSIVTKAVLTTSEKKDG